MLSAILIDDEPDALEVLQLLLERHCPAVTRIDCFVTTLGALQALRDREYDLAFLDIHLQHGENGLRFAAYFKGRTTRVVFTTAHQKYALEAFRARALHYLLKPVAAADLKHLVEEVVSERPDAGHHTLLLSDTARQVRVEERDICYVRGDGSYCEVFSEDKLLMKLSSNLRTFEQRLRNDHFYRCHQSYLVNLRCVREVIAKEGVVILTQGVRLPVSRRRRQGLDARLAVI